MRVEKVVVLHNETGLHARPAMLLAQSAASFKSRVTIAKGEKRVDAKSIISLLTLGAAGGTELTITAEGADAETAMQTIANMITGDFESDDCPDKKKMPDGH